MRIKPLSILLVLLMAATFSGCTENIAQSLRSEPFSEGKPIPLKVAVIYGGTNIYNGVDTNHDNGKATYSYTLDIGNMMLEILRQRSNKIFSEVVFIPDIESLMPGYLPLIPKDINVRTSNGKLAKNFRCGNTGYPISASASYSLLLTTVQGDPIVEYSSSDVQEHEGTWNAYCVGKKQMGGANESDYRALAAQAMRNVMAQLEGKLRASGALARYTELQAKEQMDVLTEKWPRRVILEGGDAAVSSNRDSSAFETVAKNVQEYMDQFLAPRKNEINLENLPSTIEIPELPPLSDAPGDSPEQSAYDEESPVRRSSAFLPEKRDLKVLKFQVQFRRAVERRNRLLADIKNSYLEEIRSINNEQVAKRDISMKRYYAAIRSKMLDVMGPLRIKRSEYNAGAGMLMMTIEATKAAYELEAGFAMSAREAEALMRSAKPPVPIVEFVIDEDSVRVSTARLYGDSSVYDATLSNDASAAVSIGVVFNYRTVSFTDQDAVMFAPQNPNLPDPAYLSIIAPTYSDAFGDAGFKDDLIQLIGAIPYSPPSPDRWLVAIGIERYSEADRVLFGTRSYMLLLDAAKKALRIPQDHVLGLMNEQATAREINSLMADLLKKVKPGDTIYFYYGGHIARDHENNRVFLLPSDMIPDLALSEGRFRLETVLNTMLTAKPSRIVMFLDAGTNGRTDGFPVMKGLQRVPVVEQKFDIDPERVTLITACRYNQSANAFPDKRHRIFSYNLIRNLALMRDPDLNSFLKRLANDAMESSLRRKDIYRQDPQIYGNTQGPL